jgi:hypothetical protein
MTDYTDNTYSNMALLKHPGGRWEIVSAERVLEDAEKAYAEEAAQDPTLPAKLSVRLRHLVKLPYEWRLLFMDETPREFRFDKEDIDDEGRPNGRKLLFGGESSDPSAILDSKIILSLKTEEGGRIDGEYAERVGKALEDFMNGVFPTTENNRVLPSLQKLLFSLRAGSGCIVRNTNRVPDFKFTRCDHAVPCRGFRRRLAGEEKIGTRRRPSAGGLSREKRELEAGNR